MREPKGAGHAKIARINDIAIPTVSELPQRFLSLCDVLGRPTFMPIPKFGPKLLLGGELADNLLFSGQRVLPAVLDADDGFTFQHPDLATALRALLGT